MIRFLLIAALTLASFSAKAAALRDFPPGFRLIDGTQLNLMVDVVNNLTGNGTAQAITGTTGTFSGLILVDMNTAAANLNPAALTGSGYQLVGANATVARVQINSFGAIGAFSLIRAEGTITTPTAITNTIQLGAFNFRGYTGAAYSNPASSLDAYATEAWSATATGTKFVIRTTPNTTTTLTDAATFGQDGSLIVAAGITATTGTYSGALSAVGTINSPGTISAGTLTLGGNSLVNWVGGAAAGYKMATGETALDGSNPTPVTTGLTTIASCTVSLKINTAPGGNTSLVTYDTTAGTLNMYGWKPVGVSSTALIASTGTDTIGWSCRGT